MCCDWRVHALSPDAHPDGSFGCFSQPPNLLEDTEIDGYRVPAGSERVAWIHLHAPFTPEAVPSSPTYRSAPACARIGQHFSVLESKIVLATMARRHAFRLAPGQRIAPQFRVTLAPKHGMRMCVEVR